MRPLLPLEMSTTLRTCCMGPAKMRSLTPRLTPTLPSSYVRPKIRLQLEELIVQVCPPGQPGRRASRFMRTYEFFPSRNGSASGRSLRNSSTQATALSSWRAR